MKQFNKKILMGLSVAGMLVAANTTLAETVEVDASVTVNNAIDFSHTGELNFGEVRATASPDVDECVGATLGTTSLTFSTPARTVTSGGNTTNTAFGDLCGATAPTVGALQSVGGTVTRPVFTIAGVAPFANLTVALPDTSAAPIPLTTPSAAGAAQFALIDFTARKTSGNTPAAITTSIMTDADGGATFTVGATLITEAAAVTAGNGYQDVTYSGSFEVSVTY